VSFIEPSTVTSCALNYENSYARESDISYVLWLLLVHDSPICV